jgi:hypothetical protein
MQYITYLNPVEMNESWGILGSSVDGSQDIGEISCLYPENRGSKFLRSFRNHVLDYTRS